MNHAQYCDELDREIERFANGLTAADPDVRVPSCPEWTVRELTHHLGMVHRWATELVSRRSPSRIPRSEIDRGGESFDAEWMREGGRALVATLRGADPNDSMWAWGADQHVRFWSRRQLHETFVHRLDLELATGEVSYVDPEVAVDAIDEFLVNMKSDGDIALRARDGRRAEFFRITSTSPVKSWGVHLERDNYELTDPGNHPDAELSGPADDVLKVLLRRCDLVRAKVTISGDPSLAEYWLSQTAFL